MREIYKMLTFDQKFDFEQNLSSIEQYLENNIAPQTKGVAIFTRGGSKPFFKALQFEVALPNKVTLDTIPHIYDLVLMKDTYHRYVVLITTNAMARIVEVCVGSVTKELWSEQPELRKRVGREWTKEHYQSHKKNRSKKFIKEKISILEKLMERENHTHHRA